MKYEIPATLRPCTIYKATHVPTNRFYIGVTSRELKVRKRQHLLHAKSGKTHKLAKAIREYGIESFHFDPICIVPGIEFAYFMEARIISVMKPYYNSSPGGTGTIGFKMNPESLAKAIAARKGNLPVWTGKTRPPEVGARISKALKGKTRKHTEKSRAALRINHAKAIKARRKKVLCVTDGIIFDSIKDASNHYGYSRPTIVRLCSASGKKSRQGKEFIYG